MIEQIAIHNFQAHRDLIIPIERTLTVIRGPTDAGKSSVIRANRWLCHNRPGGKAFITNGQKECFVSFLVDGHKVVRKKKPGFNGYILDGENFKAVGLKVPEKIQRVLNIGEMNFQFQRDQPLWVALTPSQASKELNRIINLELIDSSLAFIGKETRRHSVLVDGTKGRLIEAKRDRRNLSWALEADKELRRIEGLHTQILKKRERMSAIERLLTKLDSLKEELAGSSQRSLGAVAIRSLALDLRKRQGERDRLQSLIERFERIESTLDVETCHLSKLQTQLKKVKKCPTCRRPLLTSSNE